MCNVRTKVIPIIMETTGTLSKSFRKYLGNITGKHETKATNTAILSTAHALQKVLT
jgi:hypothetical protein